MELSIIIVNYNVRPYLQQCLYSVRKAITGLQAEVLVADNLSADDSKTILPPLFPEVQFFWLPQNAGFGAANNHALQFARGKYILFLNPDTLLTEDCLQQCLAYMRAHKNCGALGVRMIDGRGNFLPESKRMLPNAIRSLLKLSGAGKLFKRSAVANGYYAAHIPEQGTGRPEVLAGACMLVSEKAISLTGGFDTDFFMYGEDIDLSYRIHKAGLTLAYLGSVAILHFKGESSKGDLQQFRKDFYNAMKIFVNKHYKGILQKTFLKAGVQLTRRLRPALPGTAAVPQGTSLGVVCSGNDFDTLKTLLEKNLMYTNIFLMEVNQEADEKMLLENFSEIVYSEKPDDMAWYTAAVSYNTAIGCMQKLPGHLRHYFIDPERSIVTG